MTTLIGTNPDQIPINSMLGGMAYQDPDSINVKDFNSSGSSTINTIMCTGLLSGLGQIYLHNGEIQKSNGTGLGLGGQSNLGGPETLQIYGPSSSGLILVTASSFGYLSLDNSALNLTAGSGKELYLYANNTPHIRVTTTGDILNLGTGATKLQEGTTAQRPASPQEGMIRKNSTLGVIEGYSEGGYVSLEAGRLIARTVYSTPGSYTWTPNSKTKHVIAILVSAGGGSGGCPPTNATQGAVSAPGKNGQYMRCEIPRDSTLGTNYAVVVGAGGSYGFGGVSPTSGGSGGDSSITNNTSGAVISVIGGGGGDPGYTSTTFPFVRSSDGAYLSTNTGGHFVIWERSFSVPIYCVLFGLNGDIMLSQPSVHSIGVSSGFKGRGARSCLIGNNSASGSTGFAGDNGEVIIYEYS